MNPKKKILFLITKATWGGAQKYVFDLATNLPKDQFEPLVAYGTPGKLAEDLQKAAIETIPIQSLGRNIALLSDVQSFFEILKILRATTPDVVHLNSSKAAAIGVLAAHYAHVPRVIFTVHGWPFKESRNPLSRALIYIISWFTAFVSHAVIVVSKHDEKIGKSMSSVCKRILYIPLGISPVEFLAREEASARLSISAPSPRIGTIAELTKNKGIGYAIQAMSELKLRNIDVSYFVIGEGEERGALENMALKKNVSDRVHFLGFVPHAAQYLKAFDVFLLPSIKEGAPYVLLEAQEAQLPTITTDAVDVASTLQVSSGDAHALAEAVIKIQGMSPRFTKHHTLQEMLKLTTALY